MRPKRYGGRGVPATLGAVGVAVLLAFLAALAGGCGEEQASSPPADEAAEQGPTTVSESAETTDGSAASVGDTITVGDVRWSVRDTDQLNELYNPRFGPKEGRFVITDIVFQNNSNQDISMATPFLTLVDSEGREYEPDIDSNFTYVDPDRNMFVEPIKPGATKEGAVIFPVAPDASGFKLRVGTARFSSNETGYIDLGF